MKKITLIFFLTIVSMLSTAPGYAQHTSRNSRNHSNGEESWQSLSSLRDMYNMFCMTFKDENNGWVGGQGIIVHTADGGKTWEKQYTGPGSVRCIYFKNAKDGFAGGESNLYMTTHDGGKTWTSDMSHFQSASFKKIFFVNDQTGYMLSTGSVYRSTDGGKNWKDIGPKKPSENSSRDYLGLTARDAKHLIVVGEEEMMFTSADGGTTWEQNKKDFFSGPRRNLYGVAFNDANTGFISCSSGSGDDIDCLCTTDGGATWTTKKLFNSYQLKTLEFNGNAGWATTPMNDHAILVTNDGGATWEEQTVTNDNRVFGAYRFPSKGYVGVNTRDYYFNLFVPKQ